MIPKSYIQLSLAPQEVMVKLNNKETRVIRNGDKLSLNPGKYSLVFFRNEFAPRTENVEIKNLETLNITVVLKPLTDRARDLLKNDESIKVMEKYTAEIMDEQVEILKSKYPIVKVLPVENPYYRIYGCPSLKYPYDATKLAICLSIDDLGFKNDAYKHMLKLGYDLNKYEVIVN